MPNATALDTATAMIEKTWARPIEALESLAARRPGDDPLLRSAMHIRSAMIITDSAAAVHQDRLHTLTRSGHVLAFSDLERITASATGLRAAHAKSNTYLQAVSHVIEAREAAAIADPAPTIRLAQAAVARSGHAPRAPGQAPGQPAPSAPVGPTVGGLGPHR
ncbi:hypothetical protein OG244_03905 [Streptomyces brevispora]|uniref:hypothetical protein n=1 Tax=Streptomyces brevispora TaxID=887462 RepID=UPI002E36FA9D|nr:hypothetical protein [Streptomyces brevispora]